MTMYDSLLNHWKDKGLLSVDDWQLGKTIVMNNGNPFHNKQILTNLMLRAMKKRLSIGREEFFTFDIQTPTVFWASESRAKWSCQEPESITVRTLQLLLDFTGVCRSNIDIMRETIYPIRSAMEQQYQNWTLSNVLKLWKNPKAKITFKKSDSK